ncbi:sigma-70 family RNA polymerase sigma factor, partial [Clostridioides difficile]|nr:sigma-70 family RNA polymerase sigma factor [Clostridioides difficile]
MLIYLSIIDSEEEKDKFEKIYEKYKKLMFYIANQILQDEQLSEDAVHNAFLKIIDNL